VSCSGGFDLFFRRCFPTPGGAGLSWNLIMKNNFFVDF
jgi:hypothetical protein